MMLDGASEPRWEGIYTGLGDWVAELQAGPRAPRRLRSWTA